MGKIIAKQKQAENILENGANLQIYNYRDNDYYNEIEHILDYKCFPENECNKNIKKGASTGFDIISSNLLKQVSEYTLKLITYSANLSFKKNLFRKIHYFLIY